MGYRYFITEGDAPELEVTKQEFVSAEHSVGLYSKSGPYEVATEVFDSILPDGSAISGRVERIPGMVQ